jgi:uncharacterized OB-fold protein
MPIEPAEELWRDWTEGRLSFQMCDSCHTTQHPPGRACGNCHSTSLRTAIADGRAELVTWSTVHRAPSPGFAADVPYLIGIAALVDGALVEGRVVGAPAVEDLRPGLPVTVYLADVNGRTLPVIRVGTS